MKKISIVTWIGNGNFGTALQSYALQYKLKKIGYDTNILQYFDFSFNLRSSIKSILSFLGISKVLKRKVISTYSDNFFYFIKHNYYIRNIYTKRQYKSLLNDTDVFLAGSDQIWNAWHSFNSFYFLEFAKKAKKISYASSIGTSDFPQQHKKQIKRLLQDFKFIGVRELNAVNAVNSLLEKDIAIQVLDPTFLLTREEWVKFSSKAQLEINLPKSFVLCYFIGDNS